MSKYFSKKAVEAAASAFDRAEDALFERNDTAFRLGRIVAALDAAIEAEIAAERAKEAWTTVENECFLSDHNMGGAMSAVIIIKRPDNE